MGSREEEEVERSKKKVNGGLGKRRMMGSVDNGDEGEG